MQEKILEICRNLCCKEITADEQLLATGLLYSFKIMELLCTLEEEFSIVFEPKEITNMENFSSANNIIELVKRKIKK